MQRTFLAAAVTLIATSAMAESPRFYSLEGFGEFLDGNPESTAITEDGTIILPPSARERFADAAVTFSAATALGDEIAQLVPRDNRAEGREDDNLDARTLLDARRLDNLLGGNLGCVHRPVAGDLARPRLLLGGDAFHSAFDSIDRLYADTVEEQVYSGIKEDADWFEQVVGHHVDLRVDEPIDSIVATFLSADN